MKSAAALVLACLLSAAALTACESDGDAPPPVEDTSGDYFRETETEDYSARISIPAVIRNTSVGATLIARADAEVADTARRAAERRRERPEGFAPSQLLVTWTAVYEDAGALSLGGVTRVYEGGVDVTETLSSVLYDRAAGRSLTFADLFTDPSTGRPAMTAVSEAAFSAWAEVSPSVDGRDLALVDEYALSNARETLRPRSSSFGTFVLAPDETDRSKIAGVNLLYPAGVLGPRTDGPFTLFIPAEVLAPHLRPEWATRLATEG